MSLPLRTFCFLLSVGMLLGGCKKNREIFPPVAELYPVILTGISTATVQAGFSGLDITERGICWDTRSNPQNTGPHISSGGGSGNVSSVITGLTGSTSYFVRAYATNSGGTTYSEMLSFNTLQVPVLTTGYAQSLGTNSAVITAGVSYFASAASGTYGICYATNQAPTVDDSKTATSDYPGAAFTRTLSSLNPGETYYARSFVILPADVVYGSEIRFSTYSGTVTDIDGNSYFTIKIGNQEWMASNLNTTRYRNGSMIPYVSSSQWYPNQGHAQCTYYDAGSIPIYGRLYNLQAVTNTNLLAPAGWHIPSEEEWQELIDFAGTDSAAYRLCSNGPEWFNTYSDNRYGFSMAAAGLRLSNGNDMYQKSGAYLWTSSQESGYVQTVYFSSTAYDFLPKNSSDYVALSLRCIKD